MGIWKKCVVYDFNISGSLGGGTIAATPV